MARLILFAAWAVLGAGSRVVSGRRGFSLGTHWLRHAVVCMRQSAPGLQLDDRNFSSTVWDVCSRYGRSMHNSRGS